jgi:hypothetical protein
VPPLEIGVWAIQLSPYRTGLAGRHGTRLPVPPAFPTGSCPLWLSPSGQSMTQESPFELLLTVSRMQHHVPRRTVSLHPAPQRCAPGHGHPLGGYNPCPGLCPAVARLLLAEHRSLTPSHGSSASLALLPPITSTSPARRQRILGITPGVCFFGHPLPQQHPVGTYSVRSLVSEAIRKQGLAKE